MCVLGLSLWFVQWTGKCVFGISSAGWRFGGSSCLLLSSRVSSAVTCWEKKQTKTDMGSKRTALRNALIVFCLLSLLLLLHVSDAKKDNKNNSKKGRRSGKAAGCKNKRTFSFKASEVKKTPVQLTCANGPVVALNIVAIKAKCRGTTGYTRWTAGRCMWNNTCELTFKDQVIDQLSGKVKDKSCLGKIPDKLEVGYTCLKKKVVVTDTLGTFKKTRRASGIIRSHKLLPWSYRNGKELGNVTLIRPRKPAGASNLWISVHLYAILNRDLLFLSWEEAAPQESGQVVRALRQIRANDTTFVLNDVQEVILTFYADYRRRHPSASGGEEKGFLLCYQWLKPNVKPKKGSACTRVMMPAKCKGKSKRGGGRKRKGGNAASRNRNRKSRNQASRQQKAPRNRRPSRKGQQ